MTQAGKPHKIGAPLLLPAIKDAAGVIFGGKSSKEVERIPPFNNTFVRRID
jgi:hypothetical protein